MRIAVIGGGLSGLSIALALKKMAHERRVSLTLSLHEEQQRLGGKLYSEQNDGFVFEHSANGWLDSKPSTDALVRELGLDAQRIVASEAARHRFVIKEQRLIELQAHPGRFLLSPLLSVGGKFKLLGEPWRQAGRDSEESLANFARRRLGEEALHRLIDPMASGVFAADPEKLSVHSAFPRIVELERKYGSLVRALIALKKQRRHSHQTTSAAGPGGQLVSMRLGLSQLITGMSQALGSVAQTHDKVQRLELKADSVLLYSEKARETADAVVLAVPAYAASQLLREHDVALAEELSAILYSGVVVVAVGFHESDLRYPLNGFGFLAPAVEQRSILGCLWDSTIFPGRQKVEHVLLRFMMGGARRPDVLQKTDQEIVADISTELREIMHIDKPPRFVRIIRHAAAIPQYNVGHAARLQRIDTAMRQWPRVFLGGNAYHGVGINDCTAQAPIVAQRVLDALARS